MFNFLDPKLMPKVSTKTPCMDGYEADNLISDNFLTKSRGFLAFTSIKPPVDVDFKLICPVYIHYISISTVIGSQKSTGIEILAKNPKSDVTTIAHAYFDQPGVIFCNSRMYCRDNPPPNSANYYLAFLKSHTFRQFTNANEIRIRITRTERSVPCLGKIEIWGKVSKSCSQVTMATIEQIMGRCKLRPQEKHFQGKSYQDKVYQEKDYQEKGYHGKAYQDKSGQEKSYQEKTYQDRLNEIALEEDFNIPDDFKDALTFEIMSIPMTLPSGHSIDQTTLEKCINNDNSYGRQAADPFTGLIFTDRRRPMLNVPLKTRIDMFLVENANQNDVATVQRTVGPVSGRKQDVLTGRIILTSKDSILGRKDGLLTSNEDSLSKGGPFSRDSSFNNEGPFSKGGILSKHSPFSKEGPFNKDSNLNKDYVVSKDGTLTSKSRVFSSKGNVLSSSRNNEMTLKKRSYQTMCNFSRTNVDEVEMTYKKNRTDTEDSLMETINKVMNSVNFVRFTEDNDEEMTKTKCCEDCKTEENLYELPCLHLYCRPCLLDLCNVLTCKKCKTIFCRNDPKKIHL